MSDNELKGVEVSEDALLTDGLFALNKALESIMELKSNLGKALADMVHGALVFGEYIKWDLSHDEDHQPTAQELGVPSVAEVMLKKKILDRLLEEKGINLEELEKEWNAEYARCISRIKDAPVNTGE